MRKSYNYSNRPRVPARPYVSQNHCGRRLPLDQQRHRCCAPAAPPPNFIIRLCSGAGLDVNDVKSLASRLGLCPDGVMVSPDKVGAMYFGQWTDTLKSMVSLWQARLNGIHRLTPIMVPNVVVPSDSEELQERLRDLFSEHVSELMKGELVKKWMKKFDDKVEEIRRLTLKLSEGAQIYKWRELVDTKKVLMEEKNLILKRVTEFKAALSCVLRFLGSQVLEEDVEFCVVQLDHFGSQDANCPDWGKIESFISRECNRLEDGLPIYVYRTEILKQIHGAQVHVLICGILIVVLRKLVLVSCIDMMFLLDCWFLWSSVYP